MFEPVTIGGKRFSPAVITSKWRRFKHSYEVDRWRGERVPYVHREGDPVDLKTYPGGVARGWNPLYFPNLPRKGFPDVITTHYNGFMPFGKAWQEYHFNLMKLSANGALTESELKTAFGKIYDSGRFLNNNYGVDVFRNYISGTNSLKTDPKFEPLGMGGAIVKEIRKVSYMKEWWVVYETLLGPPEITVTWKTHPHLIHHAVNELMVNGRGAISEFPQMRDIPVYYASASQQKEGNTGIQWIRESWLINE